MFRYLIKRLLSYRSISLFARVDSRTAVSPTATVWRFSRLYRSTLGCYSYMAPHAEAYYTDIGKYVSIASLSIIGPGAHPTSEFSTSSLFYNRYYTRKHKLPKLYEFEEFHRTTVDNDVWIGNGALIMGGVNIADGAIVAARAVVTKDVPPFAVVGGIPAKLIKYRFAPDVINRLLELSWWDWPISEICARQQEIRSLCNASCR